MSDDRYILDGKSFIDTKTNQCLNFGIKDLARVTITLNNMDMWLNQAEERIAELEEQLKNAIVLPKYEKGQKIYSISGKKILEGYFQCFNDDVWAEVIVNPNEMIDEDGYTDVDFDVDMFWHKNTFTTKEDAQVKLKELQGEKYE